MLNILWSLLDLRKCRSNKLRNYFSYISGDIPNKWMAEPDYISATIYFCFLCFFLKYPFNLLITIISWCCFILMFWFTKNTFVWWAFVSRSLIDVGKCFITWGGWLKDLLMYSEKLLGFFIRSLYTICKIEGRVQKIKVTFI